jgi:hypothetical protein
MTTTPLSCPFCDEIDVEYCEVYPGQIAIDCPSCQCIGPFADTPEGAVIAWNRAHEKDLKLTRLVNEARDWTPESAKVGACETS